LKAAVAGMLVIMATISTGCPKRQAPARLIYVQPAAVAPQPTLDNSKAETRVIEPPPPPEPEAPPPVEEAPVQVSPEKTRTRRQRPLKPPAPVQAEQTIVPAAPVTPSLEPHISPEVQEADLKKFENAEQDGRQRIERLSHLSLSASDLKTLQDARVFLDQAHQAMQDGDVTRALNLAGKSSLLISALEQSH
jgi:hypothetical protein